MKTVENIVKVEDCLSSDEQEGKKEEQEMEMEMEEVDVQNSVIAQSGSASSEQHNLSSESEGFDPMGAASTPTRSVQSTPEQLHQVKQPLIAELPYGYWEYQPNQVPSAEPKPKTKSQQKHAKKDHQQGPRPGAANQWYTLSSHMHKYGTTVEMMYTGVPVPQPSDSVNIRAIPGVTHVTIELPQGVLPNTRTSAPDMVCLINAMDFFGNPEKHVPEPGMGPPTTIHLTPKDSMGGLEKQETSDCIEIVPLNCERAAPLKRNSMNSSFQTYSLMELEVDESEAEQPGRLVLDADISPLYMLNTHQKLRLQAAVERKDVTMAEALLPIVDDLYEEHEKLESAGLSILPAPIPLPYGTMQFHYNEPYTPLSGIFPMHSPELDEFLMLPKMPCGQMRSQRKKDSAPRWRFGNDMKQSATIMALDQDGNYQPMIYSEWEDKKKDQSSSSTAGKPM